MKEDGSGAAPFRDDVIAQSAHGEPSGWRERADSAARAFTYSIRDFQIERSFIQSDYMRLDAPAPKPGRSKPSGT